MIKTLTIDNTQLEKLADSKAIEQLVMELADRAKSDFEKTTATWRKRPPFTIKRVTRGGDVVYEVFTDSDIYAYVNDGTRPHRIEPKGRANGGADRLAFQRGYNAKTRPQKIASFEGGSFGSMVFSDGVNHPGTDARNFTDEIVKRSERRAVGLVKAYQRNIK